MSGTDRFTQIDNIRETVQNELVKEHSVPRSAVESFQFCTRRPKDGIVFDYPSRHYIECREELVEYTELVESVLDKYVSDYDRRDISTKTDGRVSRHYWVIRRV